jgi:cell division protein ZapA
MEPIDVKILDKDYRLAVAEEDKSRLLDAVKVVDERMRAVRAAGKVSGVERIAVMTALQLANELLGLGVAGAVPVQAPVVTADLVRKIQKMTEELDQEIKRQESLF